VGVGLAMARSNVRRLRLELDGHPVTPWRFAVPRVSRTLAA
jgi:hypothetical protein